MYTVPGIENSVRNKTNAILCIMGLWSNREDRHYIHTACNYNFYEGKEQGIVGNGTGLLTPGLGSGGQSFTIL